MYYDETVFLKQLENQFLPILQEGKFNFDITIDGIKLIGPKFMSSKSAYSRRRIKFPIERTCYWIKVGKDSFYRLNQYDEYCNSLFTFEDDVEELTEEERFDLSVKLFETEQYSACICLIMQLMKIIGFNSINGGLLNNTLKSLVTDSSDLSLHLYTSHKENMTFNNNIFNLSLF